MKLNHIKSIFVKYSGYILVSFILAIFLVKYGLITNTSSSQFLATYKFMSSDSYDWVANGIRLFENDSITFRNPGLPLVIKVLNSVGLLYLLPLINQLVFLSIVYYI